MASDKTILELIRILRKNLSAKQVENVVQEISLVEGNKSFKDTVRRLCNLLQGVKDEEG